MRRSGLLPRQGERHGSGHASALPAARILLARVWRDPRSTLSLSLGDWDVLIRQARRAELLASLCLLLEKRDLLNRVPVQVRAHLESARTLAAKHLRDVRWEVRCIQQALSTLEIPVILLKGAAYVVAGLPPARGRVFRDVDILVPRSALPRVEQAVRNAGWLGQKLDPYDQRYYRLWMHQLPPMRHLRRNTELDVHHTIMPLTARLHPDPAKLLAAALPVEDQSPLFVLAPADMVLHSATHLFHEGELDHGLRDLADLDALLRHFGPEESFWSGLLERATELELARPLYYALRYTREIFATPIPSATWSAVAARSRRGPSLALMDALYGRALAPDHPTCRTPLAGLARWALFVRGHYLRMPLRILAPHLLRKTIRRRRNKA